MQKKKKDEKKSQNGASKTLGDYMEIIYYSCSFYSLIIMVSLSIVAPRIQCGSLV